MYFLKKVAYCLRLGHNIHIFLFASLFFTVRDNKRVALGKIIGYTIPRMSETQKNIPSPDISDVLTTYKSHPTTEGDDAAQSLLKNRQEITLDKDSGWSAPKSETPFEKKMYILHEGTKMFEIMVNGFVKMAKIGAWCIALF